MKQNDTKLWPIPHVELQRCINAVFDSVRGKRMRIGQEVQISVTINHARTVRVGLLVLVMSEFNGVPSPAWRMVSVEEGINPAWEGMEFFRPFPPPVPASIPVRLN